MSENNLGFKKSSFSIYYNGGEIWCEHLDAINNMTDLKQKFATDMMQIAKPSTSSFIVVILDETEVDEEFLAFILSNFSSIEKQLRKVVFVGLNREMKRYIKKQSKNLNFICNCMDDLEKAKEWLV